MKPLPYYNTPLLQIIGICSICREEVPSLGPNKHYAADHDYKGKRCRGSGCSFESSWRVIRSPEEARDVARAIQNDISLCLDPTRGHGTHSISCGDGRECTAIRQSLAKAFATYYLNTQGGLVLRRTDENALVISEEA